MLKLWNALKGAKTYLVAASGLIYVGVHYFLVGDMTSQQAVAFALGSAGLGALRHGFSTQMAAMIAQFGPAVLDAAKKNAKAIAILIALTLSAALEACSTPSPTPVNPTPAAQFDPAKALWYLQAANCAVSQAGAATAATPQITGQLDGEGNMVLTLVTLGTGIACHVSVPAAAIAPASASPASPAPAAAIAPAPAAVAPATP